MNRKTLTWISLGVFSTIFGFIPSIWGAGLFSFDALVLNAVGGIFGIWLVYKIAKYI